VERGRRRQQPRRAALARKTLKDFDPAGLLRNAHVQSVFPSLAMHRRRVLRKAAPLLAASRELIVDCGEGTRLQAFHAMPAGEARATVLLLHGWEGSASAGYLLSLGQELFEQGYAVLRLNLRDHGDTHALNRELFHSCRLPEVVGAVKVLARRFATMPFHCVGFSLGGNFLLRVAAESGAASSGLRRVIAVSPVLDPARTLHALERGLPLYRRYFVWKWSRSLRLKQAAWRDAHDFTPVIRHADLRRMTAELVSSHTSYADIDAYLEGYAITGARLASLEVPAVILIADDDPIIPVEDLGRLVGHPLLRIVRTRYGGHTGFLQSWRGDSWANAFVSQELARD
jgi:predicted alpha/beta-fold hydrolase